MGYFRFARARNVGQPGWCQAPQITKELHTPHWHGRGGIVGHREAPVVVAPRSLSNGRQEGVRRRARGRGGGAIGPNFARMPRGVRMGGEDRQLLSIVSVGKASASVRSSHIHRAVTEH